MWYVRLPGVSLNFQPQRNGRYVARPGAPDRIHSLVLADAV